MPRIVDDLIAPELTRMIRDNPVFEQHDDTARICAHQNRLSRRPGIDAVAVVIGHDQAGGAGPDGLLDESVEGRPHRHQCGPLLLKDFPDRLVLELRMTRTLRVGNALIFQPGVQLIEARHPRFGPEHLVAQIANLVLDLPFLPARGR